MRRRLVFVVTALWASALAADAARNVSVRVVDERDQPVAGMDVLLCPLGAETCFEAATTDPKGTAHFHKAPREIVFVRVMPTAGMCGFVQQRIDLRAESLTGVTLHTPPRGNLRVRLLEHQQGDAAKPLLTTEATVTIRPSPALPNGVGMSTFWPKSTSPNDRFEICVLPGVAYDVEVEIPGFYRGSKHTPGPAPGGSVEIPITVRRKPAD